MSKQTTPLPTTIVTSNGTIKQVVFTGHEPQRPIPITSPYHKDFPNTPFANNFPNGTWPARDVDVDITKVFRAFNHTYIISLFGESALIIMGTGGHMERYSIAKQDPDDAVGGKMIIEGVERPIAKLEIAKQLATMNDATLETIMIILFGEDE